MGVVEEGRSPSKLIKGDLPHKGISVFKRGHNPLQVLFDLPPVTTPMFELELRFI